MEQSHGLSGPDEVQAMAMPMNPEQQQAMPMDPELQQAMPMNSEQQQAMNPHQQQALHIGHMAQQVWPPAKSL